MINMHFAVNSVPVGSLLSWIGDGQIAIPEIQRPFVWDAVDVRYFLDSLYKGWPIGYLITWQNPAVKLKDGTSSVGKHILIDGQQRVIALMAALLGREVIDKDYKKKRIYISFNPITEEFAVRTPAIDNIASWIPDISKIFNSYTDLYNFMEDYCKQNPAINRDLILKSIFSLQAITTYTVGNIQLAPDLDIDTVTEIFIRVNSKGKILSQADFAMSKIAVNEKYGGNIMRKAIDYFCHLAVTPDFNSEIKKDSDFRNSEYFQKVYWLRDKDSDIYDPSYTDILRVAFTTEFRRGPIKDLVALLSGRNFETKQYEEAIVEESFEKLKNGVNRFMNEYDFNQFIIHIQSAGFIAASMISSQNALNFAYIIYLTLRNKNWDDGSIQRYVRRWFVMSILTGRYSSSPESKFDEDIKRIHEQGIEDFFKSITQGELSDAFWDVGLPEALKTSAVSSPYFHLYQAAQINSRDNGFLSDKTAVDKLVKIQSDVHHLFPRAYLKNMGKNKSYYNQIANYVICEKPINTAIGNKEPKEYFMEILCQCNGGQKKYGNITDLDELQKNFEMNCIPEYCISEDRIQHMTYEGYENFLTERRRLMSQKIKLYFMGL